MSGAAPGQAARTPGRAAYEANHQIFHRCTRMGPACVTWADLTQKERDRWDVIAQAATDAATEGSLRACGYTLADVARFLESEAAARERPAPELAAHTAVIADEMLAKAGTTRDEEAARALREYAARIRQVIGPGAVLRDQGEA